MIKQWFFDQKFRKLLDSRKRSRADRINTINSVTILCHLDSYSQNDMLMAGRFFEEMDIKVALCQVSSNKTNMEDSEEIISINREDYNWYDFPRQSALVKWLDQKTDLLIVLNPNNNNLISYLTAASNSKLIAAASGKREKLIGQFILDSEKLSAVTLKDICASIYDQLLNIGMKTPVLG